VSYFRPQKSRKIGPRSIYSLPHSTQTLSQKPGRVNLVSPETSPPSGGVLRTGLPTDRDAVRAILEETSLSSPAPGDPERATEARIGEVLSIVCERDQEVVGLLAWRNLGREAEILDLAVRGKDRRHGFATLLLNNFLQQATASGLEQVFLEVRESNRPAMALYKKFGFQITGRRPNYYCRPQEAALLMRLELRG